MKYEAYSNSAPATVGGWPCTFALSPFGGVGGGFEDAWRDVLVIAYEKATDTTMVVDSALYHTYTMMQAMFPDSTFTEPTMPDPDWTSSQITDLETIAAQCPQQYGVSVYMARAMLSMTDSVPYTAQHACESSAPPSARLAGGDDAEDDNTFVSEQMTIQVYPNPTTGILNVIISLNDDDKGGIEVRNYLGEIFSSEALFNGANQLNLGGFSSGMYFFSITVNDNVIVQGKEILLK